MDGEANGEVSGRHDSDQTYRIKHCSWASLEWSKRLACRAWIDIPAYRSAQHGPVS